MQVNHSPVNISENSPCVSFFYWVTLQKTQAFWLFLCFSTTDIPRIDLAHQSSLLDGEIRKIKTKQSKLIQERKMAGIITDYICLLLFSHMSIILLSLCGCWRLIVVHSSAWCIPVIQCVGQGSEWELGKSRLAERTRLGSSSETAKNNDIGDTSLNFIALEAFFLYVVLHTFTPQEFIAR